MASKTPVLTSNAPKSLPGIYSQAIVANGIVYCSGQIATDPATNKLIDGDVAAHTASNPFAKTTLTNVPVRSRLIVSMPRLQHQCIKNLTAVLEAAGSNINNVVKVGVFLADMKDFAAMNDVYRTYWGEVKPCRT